MGLFDWVSTKYYMTQAKIDSVKAVGIKDHLMYFTPVGDIVSGIKDAGDVAVDLAKAVPDSVGMAVDDAIYAGKNKAEELIESGKDKAEELIEDGKYKLDDLKDKSIELSKKAGQVIIEEAKKMPDRIEKAAIEIEKEAERSAEKYRKQRELENRINNK